METNNETWQENDCNNTIRFYCIAHKNVWCTRCIKTIHTNCDSTILTPPIVCFEFFEILTEKHKDLNDCFEKMKQTVFEHDNIQPKKLNQDFDDITKFIEDLKTDESMAQSTLIYISMNEFDKLANLCKSQVIRKLKNEAAKEQLIKTNKARYTNTDFSMLDYTSDLKFDYLSKVILRGSEQVGKSSILLRMTKDLFEEPYIFTIGVDFAVTAYQVGDTILKCQIWDTAGQERFRSIIQSYYKGGNILIFVYDITNAESFKCINHFIEETSLYCDKIPLRFLIGTKMDLEEKREVTSQEAIKFMEQKSLDYFIEVSCKTGFNIDKMIEDICRMYCNIMPQTTT